MEIDLPEDIKSFIDEVVDSFVMWDMLVYCSKSEAEAETPKKVAELLGRAPAELDKPVQKLEKLGMIDKVPLPGGETGCKLNRKSPKFPLLEAFWAYNGVQENRLRILSYLLQKKTR